MEGAGVLCVSLHEIKKMKGSKKSIQVFIADIPFLMLRFQGVTVRCHACSWYIGHEIRIGNARFSFFYKVFTKELCREE